MNIGSRIKELRNSKNLTQDQLADKCNLSKNAIWNYENDKRSPDIKVLSKIITALEVTFEELIYGSKEDIEKLKEKNIQERNKPENIKRELESSRIQNNRILHTLLYKYILSTLQAQSLTNNIDKLINGLKLDNIEQLAAHILRSNNAYIAGMIKVDIDKLINTPEDLSYSKNALNYEIEGYNECVPLDIKSMTYAEPIPVNEYSQNTDKSDT